MIQLVLEVLEDQWVRYVQRDQSLQVNLVLQLVLEYQQLLEVLEVLWVLSYRYLHHNLQVQ